jgi:hypothetical protein
VVLFSNTSQSDEDAKTFVAVFRKLWERAEAMKDGASAR